MEKVNIWVLSAHGSRYERALYGAKQASKSSGSMGMAY